MEGGTFGSGLAAGDKVGRTYLVIDNESVMRVESVPNVWEEVATQRVHVSFRERIHALCKAEIIKNGTVLVHGCNARCSDEEGERSASRSAYSSVGGHAFCSPDTTAQSGPPLAGCARTSWRRGMEMNTRLRHPSSASRNFARQSRGLPGASSCTISYTSCEVAPVTARLSIRHEHSFSVHVAAVTRKLEPSMIIFPEHSRVPQGN